MPCHPGSACCNSCKSAPSSLSGTRDWRSGRPIKSSDVRYVATGEDAAPKTWTQQILGEAGAKLFSLTTGAAGAYHGYKRTGSAGWAVAYAALGLFFPIIVAPVMVAQGFGKRK